MNYVTPCRETGKLLSPPQQIVGKVSGTTEIIITDTKALKTGSSKNAFFHYKGAVRCAGDDSVYEEATILAFYIQEKKDVEGLHYRLSLVSHPYIMRCLGYKSGSGHHQDYIFLAFPRFEETLAAYMEKSEKSGDRTMQSGRFTEAFIELIRCVVLALLELHHLGFYCPRLNGRNIAVVKENSRLTPKLWDFHALEKGNEDAKDKDWPRLGYMLKRTAENHESFSPEIDDLFQNIKNGTLKGLDILKQSALLKVRKKFENVLALNTFTLAHCKLASHPPNSVTKVNLATEQIYCNPSDKVNTAAFFVNLLDCDVDWKANTPPWLSKRIVELGFKLPKQDSLREFVWEMRCLIEHENNYLIKELITKISSWESQFNEDKDLEAEIRKAWSLLFLYAQKFATSLALKY
ncbi:unnamed protein product [Urochloa humidicola]